jgi:hypothetical protein
MPTLIVQQRFKVRLAPGQAMREFAPGPHELTAQELEHWFIQASIRAGRAALAAAPQSAASSGQQGDAARSRLLAVFPGLPMSAYKKDGVPKVQAVEAALGEAVSAGQVAEAWAEYLADQADLADQGKEAQV